MAFFLGRRQNVIEVFRAKDSAQQGFFAPSVGFNCRSRDSAAENNKESAGGKAQRAKGEEQTAKWSEQSVRKFNRHSPLCSLPFALCAFALCSYRFAFVRLRLD